jgi:hypothetical protein
MTDKGEGRYRALVDAAPDAIVAVGPDGRIVLVNAQTERIFGYRRDELIGELVEILVPEATRAAHPNRRGAYFADPRPRPMGAGARLAARRRDGSEFPAEISLSAIETEDGTLVAAAIRDATERQRAEEKFRSLLEAAPDAMVCAGPDGRIALVNAQAERLFGYGRDEMIGAAIEMLVPDAARAAHPEHRAHYFADPHPRPMGAGQQLAGRRRDGSEFPADISLSAIETDEGLLVSAAVRDVSDRLEAEAEQERLRAIAERERVDARLQQSQRLESLGQLAGGVAHDFNNLLAVIINYTEFVREELTAALEEPGGERWNSVRDDVIEVSRAGNRAVLLTRQLLAFARREVIHPQVVVLNDIVADLEQLLHRTLGEDVELTIQVEDGLWPVLADPGQIEQVLVNLAVNARDAMPGGGTLTIDTSNLHADAEFAERYPSLVPGRFVRMRVSDTGEGMPREVIDRAFEPFFTTKSKGEGTGLGLATVYGIITQVGGFVQIYSEPGLGTTFSALLPATDATAPTVETKSEPESSHRGGTILVVEDEDAMREVTRRILTRNGYTVISAASGPEALEVLEAHSGAIELLLTDVVMPKMLGKEVAERVRALRPDVRVLYMSGYAQPVLASRGTLDPGVTLVAKPFSEPSLITTVREVLDAPA